MPGTAVLLVTAGGTKGSLLQRHSGSTVLLFPGQFSKYLQVTASEGFTSQRCAHQPRLKSSFFPAFSGKVLDYVPKLENYFWLTVATETVWLATFSLFKL